MASTKECPLDVDENNHSLILMKNLDLMRKEKEGCDFTIRVDGEEIQVHRAVMSAMSDYFKAMCAHDTEENRSGVVVMKGVGFKFVEKGVEHIYGGKVSIREDDCEEFLVLTTVIQLPLLCEKIEKFLAPRLNPTKFFEFKRIAEKFSCKSLKEECDEYARMNLGAISEETEFKNLEMKCISFLLKDSKSSYSNDSKLLVLLIWIKGDMENRRRLLIDMMKMIDLERVSLRQKVYLAENEEVCYQSAECMKILLLSTAREADFGAFPARIPFSVTNNSLVVFDKAANCMRAYNPETKSCTRMYSSTPDILSASFTVAVLGKNIYVFTENKMTFTINFVDEEANRVQKKDMLAGHSNWLRAVAYDDSFYVCGNKVMERYTPGDDEWETISTDGTCVEDCALLVFNDSIFTIGGCDESSAVKSASSFSVRTKTWSLLKPMIAARQNPAAAVHDNIVYVAGGYRGEAVCDCESYNPKLDTWTKLTSMNRPRDVFTLTLVSNKLFAVGSNEDLQDAEMFDFESKKWSMYKQLSDMRIARQATVGVWLPKYMG